MDPIERLADQELRLLSADLLVQLERGTAMRPVLYLLNEARKKAGARFKRTAASRAVRPRAARNVARESLVG